MRGICEEIYCRKKATHKVWGLFRYCFYCEKHANQHFLKFGREPIFLTGKIKDTRGAKEPLSIERKKKISDSAKASKLWRDGLLKAAGNKA